MDMSCCFIWPQSREQQLKYCRESKFWHWIVLENDKMFEVDTLDWQNNREKYIRLLKGCFVTDLINQTGNMASRWLSLWPLKVLQLLKNTNNKKITKKY